ncbi:MAG TPA: 3-dehydroquinate synthase [Candidatus Polarisedimenticolia bacterium]|nr:3-dehydroquinate synthase [Candidatus Polarisedimenticolia bacterium]
MIRVPVRLRRQVDETHDVRIGRGLGPRLSVDLRRRALASRYVVVTDRVLWPKHGRRLLAALKRRGLRADAVVIPAGERNKTRRVRDRIEDTLIRLGADRGTALVALGGGVVGDLAGFVAATFHRGIPHVQIPTTLVGMVDSSIGGKTAINHPAGKNLIGAFHPPAAVYIDVDYLKTLPDRELRSGLAEVVKCGVIADPGLFETLERHADRVLRFDLDLLVRLVEACVRLKARVVSEDLRETGRRVILNYGHTVGHALETLSGYRLTHGEAVAIGLVAEARLAARAGLASAELAGRVARLLALLGLPTEIPKRYTPEAILRVARRDKKTRQGRIAYALPSRLGAMARSGGGYGITLDDSFVASALRGSSSS